MKFDTTRFGTMEVPEDELIRFQSGLIGFPAEKDFVLIPHATSPIIAWLQSTKTAELAFPVVSAHGFVSDYPDVPLERIAKAADLGDNLDDLAILVVLSAPRHQPATVNLLAPLLVHSTTRRGAQVFLEGSKYSTRELFVVPRAPVRDEKEPASASVIAASG